MPFMIKKLIKASDWLNDLTKLRKRMWINSNFRSIHYFIPTALDNFAVLYSESNSVTSDRCRFYATTKVVKKNTKIWNGIKNPHRNIDHEQGCGKQREICNHLLCEKRNMSMWVVLSLHLCAVNPDSCIYRS